MAVSTRKSDRIKTLPRAVAKIDRPRKGLRDRLRERRGSQLSSLNSPAPVLRLRIPNNLITPPPALSSECPVCGSIVAGDLKDVEEHVEHCLEAHASEDDEQEPVGRFEVADELPTAELNVEGEESRYGRPQYSFADVQRIITASSTPLTPMAPRARDQPLSLLQSWTRPQLLHHISQLLAEGEEGARCVVCLDGFRKPVVSVGCWHVCCEACWCGTLGAKRLCPQCNRITSPDDLRRIYL